jgi:hypothetical protein
MTRFGRSHPFLAATGIGLLFAVSAVAAIFAFAILLLGLVLEGIPGVLGSALLWATGCVAVVAVSVPLIWRIARPEPHSPT